MLNIRGLKYGHGLAVLLGFLILSCQKNELILESNANLPIGINGSYQIKFAGYDWQVKDRNLTKVGPGPNIFSRKNVWVDDLGRLHVSIKKTELNTWTCAEIISLGLFKNGTYEFTIKGRPDKFNENVVLGFFNYPCNDEGCEPDGTHEIDIEFAKWGDKNNDANLHYNTFPTEKGGPSFSKSINVKLPSDETIHRFTRNEAAVSFESFFSYKSAKELFFASDKSLENNSTLAMPIHINLWLFRGKFPSDDKEVEIIIKDFKFKGL
jgi:hypothetical protein